MEEKGKIEECVRSEKSIKEREQQQLKRHLEYVEKKKGVIEKKKGILRVGTKFLLCVWLQSEPPSEIQYLLTVFGDITGFVSGTSKNRGISVPTGQFLDETQSHTEAGIW